MGRIEFDKESSAVTVFAQITIKDKIVRPALALDTGATYTIIPTRIAQALGLQPELSQEKIELITASGIERALVVTLENMRVGESETNNIKAIVHDLPQQALIDGLLGLNFLRNFNLCINFKEGYLELE